MYQFHFLDVCRMFHRISTRYTRYTDTCHILRGEKPARMKIYNLVRIPGSDRAPVDARPVKARGWGAAILLGRAASALPTN